MSRNKKKHPARKRVVYNTPRMECAHANKGCCPACQLGPRFNRRFTSREVMPAAR